MRSKRKKVPRVTEFHVYGRTYRHIQNPNMPEGTLGLCDPNELTIHTCSSLTGPELFLTLIHELDHAAKFETGLHQTLDRTAMEISAESIARVIVENFDLKLKTQKKKK